MLWACVSRRDFFSLLSLFCFWAFRVERLGVEGRRTRREVPWHAQGFRDRGSLFRFSSDLSGGFGAWKEWLCVAFCLFVWACVFPWCARTWFSTT